MSFYTDNSVALKKTSVSIWKHNNNLRLLLSVEQERDLLQPRPYWKEFRFDLTPLPQGETVTAAEFRIYKTLTMGQRANRTLHISVYEIHKENRHRWRTVFFWFKEGTCHLLKLRLPLTFKDHTNFDLETSWCCSPYDDVIRPNSKLCWTVVLCCCSSFGSWINLMLIQSCSSAHFSSNTQVLDLLPQLRSVWPFSENCCSQ